MLSTNYRLKLEFIILQKSEEKIQEFLESNLFILSPDPNSEKVGSFISDFFWILEEFPMDSVFSYEDIAKLIKENRYEEMEAKKKGQNYEFVKEIYSQLQPYLDNSN